MSAATHLPDRVLHLRAFVSFVTGLSFVVMSVSGLVLYFAPRGRVANFSGWSVLGLDKEQWSDLHMTMAVLLLAGIGWHLYFNFRPLCHYLKSRATRTGMRLRELVLAAILTALVTIGTLAMWSPFSLIADWNEQIKNSQEINTGSGFGRQSGASDTGVSTLPAGQLQQDSRPRHGRQR